MTTHLTYDVLPEGQSRDILPEGRSHEIAAPERVLVLDPGARAPAAERSARLRPTETPPEATPAEVVVGWLPHPRLRLRTPLQLRVNRDEGMVTVWNDELEEIGFGDHLTEALEDFQQTVVESYLSLRADQGRLGPAMAAQWQLLQSLIEERR